MEILKSKSLVLLVILSLACDGRIEQEQTYLSGKYEDDAANQVFTVPASLPIESRRSRRSTENCDTPTGCKRFKATVYNLIRTSSPSGSTKTVTLIPKRTYSNNQPTELKETFKINKAVTETASLEFSHALLHVDSINFEENVLAIFQNSESTAIKKLKTGLSTAFQAESSSRQTRKYGVASKKPFKFERTVTVYPCEKYEITSVVEVVENAKTRYRAKLKITGEDSNSGRTLTAKEIREILNGVHTGLTFLEGNANGDEFTAVAAATANLWQTYVSKNMTDGKATPLLECQRKFRPVYKADVFNIIEVSKNEGSKREVSVSYNQTYINNGVKSQNLHAPFNEGVAEWAEFEFADVLRPINFISFEINALESMKNSFKPAVRHNTGKLIDGLSTVFQKDLVNKAKWHGVEDIKSYEGVVDYPVFKCQQVEITPTVFMKENVEVSYRVEFRITAEAPHTGKKVRAEDIRKYFKDHTQLQFVEGHTYSNEYTAVAHTTAILRENYVGIYTYAYVTVPIANCQ